MLTGFARENRVRRPVAQRLMRTLVVVEQSHPPMPRRASSTEPYALVNTSSYFRLRHSRSMKMLSRKPTFAIHADPHARGLEFIHETRRW